MAAVKSFRSRDTVSTIMMLSDQSDMPVRKPPLSKQLWKGMAVSDCFYNPARFGVEYHPATRVTEADFDRHLLTLSSGEKVRYEQLLIATGLQPRRLPGDCAEAVYFNSLADFRRVRQKLAAGGSAVVIGGGLLGVELASSLSANGIRVKLVISSEAPLTGYLSEPLAVRIRARLQAAGIECITGRRAIRLEPGGRVQLSDGKQLDADVVIPVIGQQPSVDFVSHDPEVSRHGLAVDARLRIKGLEDVFACGDVARFGVQASSFRHEENALRSGAAAGRNLAGDDVQFKPSSFLYSEFLDMRLESIGVGNAAEMKAIGEDWSDSKEQGICILTEDDLVRRVSMVNYRMDSETAEMLSSRLIGRSAEADQLQIVRTVLKPAA
ncbi:NAD(P)/FAD-dependent oxidoreductase [Wenzhouxiangella sp. XN79A]|nr:FAD/NAD(P)-binding oxidoreductase [Wenzhouxiangella sp. XN79A]NKI36346.1 NAD(P)/FAD-dependent oxidoreductase [Wenzhouxiangella sp. XN79A]